MNARPNEVFLSHSSEDRAFVEKLVFVLCRHGIPVWYSKRNIVGAQQWNAQIGTALRRCDWFVLVLSPSAVKSKWVKREVHFALEQDHFNDKIVPLRYEPCSYGDGLWTLESIQAIDFTSGFDGGCRELLRIWGIGYEPTEIIQRSPDETYQPIKQIQESDDGTSTIDRAIENWKALATSSEGNDEDRARAWLSFGSLSQKRGGVPLNTAIDAYNKAIRLKPDYAEAYHNRGVGKIDLGRYEDAVADFDEAIRMNPTGAEAYNGRANAKAELGHREEAIADFDEAIRLKPDFAEAYSGRADAKAGLGLHGEAVADYDELIRLKPDNAAAYNNRGNSRASLGYHDGAVADYEEAIRLKPDDAAAYHNRGNRKRDRGHYEEAIADYDEAIRLRPRLAMAYYNRGVSKYILNWVFEARKDFSTARDLARDAGDEGSASAAEHALSLTT